MPFISSIFSRTSSTSIKRPLTKEKKELSIDLSLKESRIRMEDEKASKKTQEEIKLHSLSKSAGKLETFYFCYFILNLFLFKENLMKQANKDTLQGLNIQNKVSQVLLPIYKAFKKNFFIFFLFLGAYLRR